MSAAVEAAAKAMSPREDHAPQYEYTARKMLDAALPHLTEGLVEFIDSWYDRWAGPGESWTAEDLATAITEELKRRIEE